MELSTHARALKQLGASGWARGAEPTRAEVEASLARHEGNVTAASRDLGVKNRFALYRIMRRLGMTPAE